MTWLRLFRLFEECSTFELSNRMTNIKDMEAFLANTIENLNKINLQYSQSCTLEKLAQELANDVSQNIGSKCQLLSPARKSEEDSNPRIFCFKICDIFQQYSRESNRYSLFQKISSKADTVIWNYPNTLNEIWDI